jgi:hypothetical protein
MLQVTVHPLRELWQVKNTALLLKQGYNGKDLLYDEYVQLLSHAASDYDNVQIMAKGKRHVYLHDVVEDTFTEDTVDTCDETPSEPFDIDTPVATIQAYASNYRPKPNRSDNNNRVHLPRDIWMNLDDKTKAIWDSIDHKFKNVILGYTPPSLPTSSFTPRRGKPPNTSFNKSTSKSRKAFLHEFLEAFNDYLEEAQEEATSDDVQLSADLEPDPPSDLLINAAKGSTSNQLPSGDICRVVSKNSKHSVHTACIEYKVSYHREHHGISPSLVDRSASDGVTGNDVRVIFKTNHTVDIKGIDNHQCTNIAIGTIGGVIRTNKGPVIGIVDHSLFLIKVPLCTHLVSLSGIKMMLMTNPFLFQVASNAYRPTPH